MVFWDFLVEKMPRFGRLLKIVIRLWSSLQPTVFVRGKWFFFQFLFLDVVVKSFEQLGSTWEVCTTKPFGWREVQSRMTIFNNPPNRGIFSTRKSQNTLFYPTASLQASLIAFLRYWFIRRMFLHHHHHVSNFPQKCKNWGFWGILPLVPNPVFRSFVKIVIWLWTSLKPKVFVVHTSHVLPSCSRDLTTTSKKQNRNIFSFEFVIE